MSESKYPMPLMLTESEAKTVIRALSLMIGDYDANANPNTLVGVVERFNLHLCPDDAAYSALAKSRYRDAGLLLQRLQE